jgi:hypothetical protein
MIDTLTELVLYAATSESLEVPIETPSDPTATPPQFALSTLNAAAPGTFATGAWSGAWTAGQTTAVTPLIGNGATLPIASGANYRLWIKVTLGGETAVWPVAVIRCP